MGSRSRDETAGDKGDNVGTEMAGEGAAGEKLAGHEMEMARDETVDG